MKQKLFYAIYDNECGVYIETGYNYDNLTDVRQALIDLLAGQVDDDSDYMLMSKMSLENLLAHLNYSLYSDTHKWPDFDFNELYF